jgi:carbon monoxide dehydrogenase subunit G
MSELLRDRLLIAAPPSTIWAIVDDTEALGRVLPGLETIAPRGPGAFAATLAAKIQFLTIRADVEAILDRVSPDRARLRLAGRPRGLVGTFTAEIPFEVRGVADPVRRSEASAVEYAVDLTVAGRLAAFGAPLLRDTFRRQVAVLVANIEAEHRRRTADAASARAAEGADPAAGGADPAAEAADPAAEAADPAPKSTERHDPEPR